MGLNSQTYRLTILQATVLIGSFLLTLFYGCGESGHSVTDTRRAFLSPSDTLSKIAASTQRAAGSNLPVEVGRVSELTHKWKRVRFTKKFTNPVVIAHTSSGSGHDPFVVRIDDVNSSEFDIRVQDWDYLEDIHGDTGR